MITIDDILIPKHVLLEIGATTEAGAIHEVAELLKGDDRVTKWNGFVDSLRTGNSCLTNETGFGICIPHTRTDCVSAMVMAAGRSVPGIWFESAQMKVHYILVIGVPVAMASDYLRIIGALARIFRSAAAEKQLRLASTRQEFVRLLSQAEMPI